LHPGELILRPELHTLFSGNAAPFGGSLNDKVPLKLSDRTEDGVEKFSGWQSRVDAGLIEDDKVDLFRLQPLCDLGQMKLRGGAL
jgi:hypothetical protein